MYRPNNHMQNKHHYLPGHKCHKSIVEKPLCR